MSRPDTDFTPCKGKTACRDDGQRCLTCGRSLAEIARLRELVQGLAELAIHQGYGNVEAYAAHVADRIVRKVRHLRQEEAGRT